MDYMESTWLILTQSAGCISGSIRQMIINKDCKDVA